MTAGERVAEVVRGIGDGRLLVLTGAGVSAASGISTFRGSDPDAIWTRDTTEMATRRFFEADPVESWRWYIDRFAKAVHAEPNPAHRALVGLEARHRARDGSFTLITQNVDTLHERAGSETLIKVHGSLDRVRCSREGCRHGAPRGSFPRDRFDFEPFAAAPERERLPHCPDCGSVVRPHVLWFDEYYTEHEDYGYERAVAACGSAACLLVVGTSLAVGITELALQSALGRGIPVLHVEPTMRQRPSGVERIEGTAETVLPEALDRLEPGPG